MKLDYFTLVSSNPIYIENIGHIKSPTIKEIEYIKKQNYDMYLNLLLMLPENYFELTDEFKLYQNMSNEDKSNLNLFELITNCKSEIEIEILKNINLAINFFIVEDVVYMDEYKAFFVYKKEDDRNDLVGAINKINYNMFCDIVAQLNYVDLKKRNDEIDLSKTKSKKALEIYQILQEEQQKQKKINKENKNFNLGNIKSKINVKHPSLNFTNIDNLTIYQLYDTFYSLINDNACNFQNNFVAVNGSKQIPDFDYNDWYKNRTFK